MELIASIILIIITYCICHANEWVSNNRTTPPGYRHDYDQANYDITMYGKEYYHRKNARGGYDVPNNKR